jgi:hypothetical protein
MKIKQSRVCRFEHLKIPHDCGTFEYQYSPTHWPLHLTFHGYAIQNHLESRLRVSKNTGCVLKIKSMKTIYLMKKHLQKLIKDPH